MSEPVNPAGPPEPSAPRDPLATAFTTFRSTQAPLVQPAGLAPVRVRAQRRRRLRVAGACALALAALAGPFAAFAVMMAGRPQSTVAGWPSTPASAPPSTPASAPPSTVTPTTTPSTSATPACRADQLTPAVTGGGAMASQPWVIVAVRNTSATRCHLEGYPDLRMRGYVMASGGPSRPVTIRLEQGAIYMRQDPGPSIVELAPGGGAASFAIGTATAYDGPLYAFTGVGVIVPGERTPLDLAVQTAGNAPAGEPVRVTVTAFVAGAEGPPTA